MSSESDKPQSREQDLSRVYACHDEFVFVQLLQEHRNIKLICISSCGQAADPKIWYRY